MRTFLYVCVCMCVRACGLFNDAISGSDYRTSNDRVDNERWVGKGLEGNGRGIFQSTLPAFACCDWWNARKFSVSIDCVQAKIRIKYLQNTSSERCRYTNLLCDPYFAIVINWLTSWFRWNDSLLHMTSVQSFFFWWKWIRTYSDMFYLSLRYNLGFRYAGSEFYGRGILEWWTVWYVDARDRKSVV
jgi:hypothetical protein